MIRVWEIATCVDFEEYSVLSNLYWWYKENMKLWSYTLIMYLYLHDGKVEAIAGLERIMSASLGHLRAGFISCFTSE